MPLLTQETAVFFLKQNTLEAYSLNNTPPKGLNFPTAALLNQEIVDRTLFEKTLKDFLQQLNVHEAVIILSTQIIYGTMIAANTLEKQQPVIQNFFEQIPFDEEKIAKKIVITKSIICMAVNKDYYTTVKSIAEQLNIKIKAVLPAPLFTQQEENITELITNITKQEALVLQADFLIQNKQEISFLKNESNEPTAVTQETKTPPNKTQYILLGVCFFILLSAGIFVLVQQGIIFKTPNNTIPVTLSPAVIATPIPTPTLIPSPIPTLQLTVTPVASKSAGTNTPKSTK